MLELVHESRLLRVRACSRARLALPPWHVVELALLAGGVRVESRRCHNTAPVLEHVGVLLLLRLLRLVAERLVLPHLSALTIGLAITHVPHLLLLGLLLSRREGHSRARHLPLLRVASIGCVRLLHQ